MSENNDPTPDTPEVPDAQEAQEAPEPEAPAKRTFRDRLSGTGKRLRGTRGLVAATLAALIVGGFGGAAIHAAVDGDRHEHERFFRGPGEGRDFGGRMGGGGRPGGPGDFFREAPPGFHGQLPPTNAPDDEESPPTPTPSESSSS
jgi:hypothetical protein